ncbi:MAG: carbohydrate-binding protein [Firmicutes bacterium]|nr:carbohydrate-binding protein [Bacillota bacterium]
MKVNVFNDKILDPPATEIGDDTYFKAAENIIWSQTARAETTSDTDGGRNLGYCDAGAWTEYRIKVAKSGQYDLSARTASNAGAGAFDVVVDGEVIASFDPVYTGGWQNWATLDAQSVHLEEGSHTLRLEFTESGSNVNWLRFTMTNAVNGAIKDSLKALHDAWASEDLSVYSKESAAALTEALEAAEAVLSDTSATQKEITDATVALVNAIGNLEYGVQKVHLETAIEFAEKLLELENNYEDTKALKAALAEGKIVLANADATQEEADNAAYAILDELAKLAKKADVASLESLIEAAEGLLSDKYTSDSVEALKEAIDNAKEVLEDPNRADSAIADAYREIIDAVIGLQMRGNKAALAAMIAKAEKVLAAKDSYVAASIEGIEEELEAAVVVYNDEDALQDEINEAVKALTLEVADARLLGDVDSDGAVTTADSAAVLRSAAELDTLSAEAALSADVNGDGAADTNDAVLILQFAAEKIAAF